MNTTIDTICKELDNAFYNDITVAVSIEISDNNIVLLSMHGTSVQRYDNIIEIIDDRDIHITIDFNTVKQISAYEDETGTHYSLDIQLGNSSDNLIRYEFTFIG